MGNSKKEQTGIYHSSKLANYTHVTHRISLLKSHFRNNKTSNSIFISLVFVIMRIYKWSASSRSQIRFIWMISFLSLQNHSLKKYSKTLILAIEGKENCFQKLNVFRILTFEGKALQICTFFGGQYLGIKLQQPKKLKWNK